MILPFNDVHMINLFYRILRGMSHRVTVFFKLPNGDQWGGQNIMASLFKQYPRDFLSRGV